MNQKTSFYAERYQKTISILKEHGLWDLKYGLLFLPLIQHCMPYPSLNEIYKLLDDLVACEVDSDWAPLEKMKELKNKVFQTIKAIKLVENEKGEKEKIKGLGENYPISLGIQRINNLKLNKVVSDIERSKMIKRNMIILFVETVYSKMGAEEDLIDAELYLDVYQVRDVIIDDHITNQRLNFSGGYTKGLEKKRDRSSLIFKDIRRIGSGNPHASPGDNFWNNPPHAPFSIPTNERKTNVKPTDLPRSEPEEATTRNPSDAELLRNNAQQRANLNTSRVKWARSNVRSLADPNQLPFSSIFRYWEYLLEKNEKSLFIVSVITFLTGIPKKRWLNCIKTSDLTAESIRILEESNAIEFKLASGATQFASSEVQNSDLVLLNLPVALKLTHKIVAQGVKEESRVRAFNRQYSGPSLMLNNLARSGHNLLRKLPKGETLAFFLTGRTPVEFRNRTAYLSTDNQAINELLNECVNQLKVEVSRRTKTYPKVYKELSKIQQSPNPAPQHTIGSQLTGTPWNFSSIDLQKYTGNDIQRCIKITNQLILYYYWMLQFALSARPRGSETKSTRIGKFWLHKDKDSEDYVEAKVLLTPDLLIHQANEVTSCAKSMVDRVSIQGYIFDQDTFDLEAPAYYEVIRNKVRIKKLTSKTAIQLSKQYWNLIPTLDRPNSHRHQAASFMYQQLGEKHTDVLQGHHIDGWDFSALDSTSSIQIMSDVLEIQKLWLKKVGFHLIKSPLQ
jgi:hypothetical protein